MKAMIITDFISMKNMLKQTALLWIVLLLALSVVAFNSSVYTLYAGPLEATMIMQGFMLGEEKGKWVGARLALPLSRSQVVMGRYASLAIIAVGATLLAAFVHLFVGAVDFAFPAVAEIAYRHVEPDLSTLVVFMGGSIALSLLLMGVSLPFIARFESVKGITYAFAAIDFALMVGMMVAINPSSGLFVNGVAAFTTGPANALLLAVGLAAAGCALYVASATIAVRLYSKREF